jgi:hypothetical protein
MSKKSGALLAVVLAMAWAQAQSAPITYNVFATGKTSTLTGSITLKDGELGEIGVNDIASWSFVSTGNPDFLSSGTSGFAGGIDCANDDFCFFATASELSSKPTNSVQFSGQNVSSGPQIFVLNTPNVAVIDWSCKGSCFGDPDQANLPQDRVFARADPSAPVPEPGSLALAGVALAAAFVTAGRRYRRGSTAAT